MGTDIHTVCERKKKDGSYTYVDRFKPFDHRSYSVFAFLANVRNMSEITPISEPRGLPEDMDDDVKYMHMNMRDLGEHSFSWLSVEELLNYDYDQMIHDKRTSAVLYVDGSTPRGRHMSLRDFLGRSFFQDLECLKILEIDRVVFGFDS